MENQPKELKINIAQDHKPVFSNTIQTMVTNEEVVCQFVFMRPNTNQGNLVAEVILTPQHAIRFKNALDKTIKQHFTKHIK